MVEYQALELAKIAELRAQYQLNRSQRGMGEHAFFPDVVEKMYVAETKELLRSYCISGEIAKTLQRIVEFLKRQDSKGIQEFYNALSGYYVMVQREETISDEMVIDILQRYDTVSSFLKRQGISL